MKKVWPFLLTLALLIGLCACGGGNSETQAPTGTSAEAQTEAPTEAPTGTEATTAAETEAQPTELERLKAEFDKVAARHKTLEIDAYDAKIAELEAKSQQKGGIVFYGSSGFTRWSTAYGNTPLEKALTAADGTEICLNHGFGGSTVHQLVHYYDRMVKAYEPQVLVISSYLNDISKGYSNSDILICLQYLVELARTDMPGIRFYITDYRPTVASSLAARYKLLNEEIGKYCAAHDDCTFVELSKEPFYYTDPKYCGTYTHVDASKYVEDGVHYTNAGYEEFAGIWKRVLADELNGGVVLPK